MPMEIVFPMFQIVNLKTFRLLVSGCLKNLPWIEQFMTRFVIIIITIVIIVSSIIVVFVDITIPINVL